MGYWWNILGSTFWCESSICSGQWELCQDFFEPTYSVACDPTEPAYPTGTLYQILYSTQKTGSKAAYAQMDWSVTDRWTLTGGVRYTEEEKDFYAGQAYLAGHDIGEGRTSLIMQIFIRNGMTHLLK